MILLSVGYNQLSLGIMYRSRKLLNALPGLKVDNIPNQCLTRDWFYGTATVVSCPMYIKGFVTPRILIIILITLRILILSNLSIEPGGSFIYSAAKTMIFYL